MILLQAVKAWREQNGGKLPGSSKEKAAFKELIKAWQRKIDGVPVQVTTLFTLVPPNKQRRTIKAALNDVRPIPMPASNIYLLLSTF